jgi:vancomycin permeability regulator SanA
LKSFFKFLLFFCVAWYVLHSIAITYDGLKKHSTKTDIALVLGTTVNYDGSLSPRLKARLDECLLLYKDSLISEIFVSGGLGKEGHWEASKMAEYLIQNGIDKQLITIDNYGNTTQLSVDHIDQRYSKEKSMVVISQYFHLSRTKLALRKKGFNKVYGSSPNYFEWRDVYSIFREFFGYYWYWI